MPTIKDVAREAGVSIATVSYVLNNKGESISEETRHLVLEAAERIGYTPNITARNLRSSRTHLIGYAWHEVPIGQVNPILDRFTYHLAHAAEDAGYHILTFTQPADDPVQPYDTLMRTGRLDAFVLAGTHHDDPRIQLMMERGFPFASFGRSNPELDFLWVDVDGEAGVTMAIEHFISLGHHRIAMVGWADEPSASATLYRVNGFKKTMHTKGLPIPDGYIVFGEHSERNGREAMAQWCQMPADERPTAVFAISDLEAIGVMNEAKERGLVVGRDISVIGFDDVPMSQYLSPPLTTLKQPIYKLAETLIGMLDGLLQRRPMAQRHVLVPPQLVVRQSCGAPPA